MFLKMCLSVPMNISASASDYRTQATAAICSVSEPACLSVDVCHGWIRGRLERAPSVCMALWERDHRTIKTLKKHQRRWSVLWPAGVQHRHKRFLILCNKHLCFFLHLRLYRWGRKSTTEKPTPYPVIMRTTNMAADLHCLFQGSTAAEAGKRHLGLLSASQKQGPSHHEDPPIVQPIPQSLCTDRSHRTITQMLSLNTFTQRCYRSCQ